MRRETIISVEEPLTTTQRRDFKKKNPGYRLCIRLRYPDAPLIISITALLLVIVKLILGGMLR